MKDLSSDRMLSLRYTSLEYLLIACSAPMQPSPKLPGGARFGGPE